MKILLSPAKSIQITQDYPKVSPGVCTFLNDSEKLISKMKKMKPKKLAEIYGVSQDIAELNYNRFQHWKRPEHAEEDIMPAVFAFTGEVYRGLNSKEMSLDSLHYLDNHLFILSGLYGLLKPMDLIYPYRLEMGTKLDITPKVKSLYQFWGDKLTKHLNDHESELVVNLASTEYFKAINPKKTKAKIITPLFKEFKNGEYKMLMTYAKNARGEMTRFCAENNVQKAEDLKKFNLSGYAYMENLSSETEYVFVRG